MSTDTTAGSDDLERRVNELEARVDAMSNWVESLEDQLAEERADDEERRPRPSKHPEDYN